MTSELGSELGDDKTSVNWPKKKKPEKESLASYLAKFEMPEVPLLQLLLDDVASELKKYREYWKKRREQYKMYSRNVQETCSKCLDSFKQGLYIKEADFTAGGAAQPPWTPANHPETGFAGQE